MLSSTKHVKIDNHCFYLNLESWIFEYLETYRIFKWIDISVLKGLRRGGGVSTNRVKLYLTYGLMYCFSLSTHPINQSFIRNLPNLEARFRGSYPSLEIGFRGSYPNPEIGFTGSYPNPEIGFKVSYPSPEIRFKGSYPNTEIWLRGSYPSPEIGFRRFLPKSIDIVLGFLPNQRI